MLPSFYLRLAKKATAALTIASVFLAPSFAIARIPNDPGYALQSPMWAQIHAPEGWELTTGASTMVVAVIDTGADIWHPDLYQNIWTNPYEIPENGIDDDKNGYVDDLHGWNFVENTNDVRAGLSAAGTIDAGSVTHGTVIAGLLGAVGDNGRDGTGLNWKVKIMPLRAIESSGSGKYSAVINAINYAVDNGAKVISMSFVGDDYSSFLDDALYHAYRKGTVVVAAAGNHDPGENGDLSAVPRYPACFSTSRGGAWMLSVGAVDSSDRPSFFSNFGNCVNIWAPGDNIVSTQWFAPSQGYTNEFSGTEWRGTSFAVPFVAGTAALVMAVHPDWSPDKVISVLRSSADPLVGTTAAYTGGRLNVASALRQAVAEQPLPTVWQHSLYYYSGASVWRVGGNENVAHVLITPEKNSFVALSSVYRSPGEVVFVLSRHGALLHLRSYTQAGEMIRDQLVVPPKNVKKYLTKTEFKAYINSDGVPEYIFNWLPDSGNRVIEQISMKGDRLAAASVPRSLSVWDIDNAHKALWWASSASAQTVLRSTDMTSGATSDIATLKGIVAADDIRAFPDSVALTVRGARDSRLYMIDLAGVIRGSTILVTAKRPEAWHLWTVQNWLIDALAIAAFPATQKGNRAVYDTNLSTIGTISVPLTRGSVYAR